MAVYSASARSPLSEAHQPLFSFVVDGEPIAWARARGGSEYGGFYTPKRQRSFKAVVGSYCRVAMLQARVKPIMRPHAVALSVRVFLSVPVTWKRTKPEEYARAINGGLCIEKPDLDNWIKLPMDAMKSLAWEDDDQVAYFPESGKWFDYVRPRLEVDVWEIVR